MINIPYLITTRFPLVLEQLLVFELAMRLELVTLRKLNEQHLRHSSSKVATNSHHTILLTNQQIYNAHHDIITNVVAVIALVILLVFAGSRTAIAQIFTSQQ